MKKPQPPDPQAPPLAPTPANNMPYWLESQRTAEMMVNDGRGPRNGADIEPWLMLADEWRPPKIIPALDIHAHHPSFWLFGYERPGGGQR